MHLAVRYIRFYLGKVNLYKVRWDMGLKGFVQERLVHATEKN